jgi:hypothetical protein
VALGIPLSVGWFSPPNQDEFLPYHQIYCSTFPEASKSPYCAAFNLQIAGIELPLRSWWYIGITPSIFYYPLYKIWPHYLSARLLGFGSLLLFAWLLARFAAIPFAAAGILAVGFFPIAFQTVIDTGPVCFHLILCLLLPLLFRKKLNIGWAMILGQLVFVAIQHKPLFGLLLPAILIVSMWEMKGLSLKRPVLPVLFFIATSSTLWYLQLRVPQGMTYQELIQIVSGTTKPWDFVGQWDHFRGYASPYLSAFEKFAHQCFVYLERWSALTGAVWVVLVGILVWGRKISRNAEITFYFLCSMLAFLTLNLSLRSSQGHHFVLAVPYLLVAVAIAWRSLFQKKADIAIAVLSVFLLLNGALTFKTLRLEKPILESPSKMALFEEYKNSPEAKSHLSVALDWGIYYLFALYGPQEQLIIPVDELKTQAVADEIQRISRATNRPVCYYSHNPSTATLSLVHLPPPIKEGWQRVCVKP